MKTIRKDSLTEKDKDRLIKAWRTLCGIGLGGSSSIIYTGKLGDEIDAITDKLENLAACHCNA